ncbi:MAG: hypothetical protein K9K82_08250, partial [Desulfobacteraceae bacterium]|nr:hypothetical protein [Desulfobacteraceae bacterium]
MITLKLFPTLRAYLPPGRASCESFTVDPAEIGKQDIRVRDLIAYLELPENKVHMTIVNGTMIRNFNHKIEDRDT